MIAAGNIDPKKYGRLLSKALPAAIESEEERQHAHRIVRDLMNDTRRTAEQDELIESKSPFGGQPLSADRSRNQCICEVAWDALEPSHQASARPGGAGSPIQPPREKPDSARDAIETQVH